MVNISEDMTKDDLNNLKFLLGNTLSRDRIEKAKVQNKMTVLFCFHYSLWQLNSDVII